MSLFAGLLVVLHAGVFHVKNDLISFWNTHHTRLVFHGIPVVILWAMFLAAAMQLHVYGMYFAYSLLNAWKARAATMQPPKTAYS